MQNLILFIVRASIVTIFQWITYYAVPAQASFFLTSHSQIVLGSKARVSCGSVIWLGNATVRLGDSACWSIHNEIIGSDTNSRFFILENNARIKRKINGISSYLFPVGYNQTIAEYRGFTLDMKSLGHTGTEYVSLGLIPSIYGSISYNRYFPSNDSSCVASSSVSFSCLSQDGWHCDGPSDYEYSVSAVASNSCRGFMNRIIKTGTGTNNWEDSIESVIGRLGKNFCEYSDWSGTGNIVLGGRYKDFSDFTVASSVSVLPVTLVELKAEAINNSFIRVSWKTALEINNDKFLISRSTDGSSFAIIGEIDGNGNTTIPQHYNFDDMTAMPNIEYYYRLEQVDYDGVITMSDIVSAKIEQEEVLETKYLNILGQEIPENTIGVHIVQTTTRSGVSYSKVLKPLQ